MLLWLHWDNARRRWRLLLDKLVPAGTNSFCSWLLPLHAGECLELFIAFSPCLGCVQHPSVSHGSHLPRKARGRQVGNCYCVFWGCAVPRRGPASTTVTRSWLQHSREGNGNLGIEPSNQLPPSYIIFTLSTCILAGFPHGDCVPLFKEASWISL